jgi:hypothetical protein
MGLPVAALDTDFYHPSRDCLLSTSTLLLPHALPYASAASRHMSLLAFANAATAAYIPTAATTVVSAAAFFYCCLSFDR